MLDRWTLGAKDIMFTNKYNSRFFSLGQVISTERGGGLNQPVQYIRNNNFYCECDINNDPK